MPRLIEPHFFLLLKDPSASKTFFFSKEIKVGEKSLQKSENSFSIFVSRKIKDFFANSICSLFLDLCVFLSLFVLPLSTSTPTRIIRPIFHLQFLELLWPYPTSIETSEREKWLKNPFSALSSSSFSFTDQKRKMYQIWGPEDLLEIVARNSLEHLT